MPRSSQPGEAAIAEAEDRRWMKRALELAEKSVGLASPNPAVGCVLVRDGSVAGEGFHQYDALDHAEIVALKQAGARAAGATAYVTLEPCNHYGRTGPCTEALAQAGIRRVVAATEDPNPRICKLGFERLRGAGVEVVTGVLSEEARRINDGFAKFTRTGLPFVTMKISCSLDGRIAPAGQLPGAPVWLTGEAVRGEVHRMRHAADALLTGIGTVLTDDPLLTDRSGLPRRRPLLRVVLDSALRTPPGSQLVRSSHGDLIVFFLDAAAEARQVLEARGIRVKQLPSSGSVAGIPLEPALRFLGESGITTLLVEAGARVNAALLNSGFVDQLVVFYAPTMLGSGALPALATSVALPPIQNFTLKRFDEDFAFAGYLRDPWAGID